MPTPTSRTCSSWRGAWPGATTSTSRPKARRSSIAYNSGVAASADRLKQVPLFSELEGKQLRSVVSAMTERTFPAGSTVTEEGTGGVGFFVIDDGEAEVTVAGEPRGTLGPGDHFGEIALIAKVPRSATIVATTDLRCYGLTQWQFRPLVEGDAHLAWKLLEALARMVAR